MKSKTLAQDVLIAIKQTMTSQQEDGGGEWITCVNDVEYSGEVDKRGLIVMRSSNGRARRFRIRVEELPAVKRGKRL